MTTDSQHSPDRVRTASQIRRDFIDFFAEQADHTIVPSSPVVPHDDPTLLFTNAGMNQFKDVFLGQGTRPYTRAVDTQKCIRAGGKHNDLEDVGRDTYHHTFFEMLGNWSFGDYFKSEAITWHWKLLTEVWGLPKDRLYVTVFEGSKEDGTEPDEEAHELWLKNTDVDPSHITRWGRKENFWEMGATGPCGPCSEVHYDGTPDGTGSELVNLDHPDVIELCNLVFIQFNRRDDGTLVPLPAKHIDTGMGFERIVRVLQGKSSNYDTDLWTPLFDAIHECSGARPYSGQLEDPTDIAYRVIADHIRCLVVALADGARPGNEGRAYVLRRILRRAVRMVHQSLGVQEPMLCRLVPAVEASLGEIFPEIRENAEAIADVIRDEELAFLRTLERGLVLFEQAAQAAADQKISGEAAFALHDTYGFPIDLTELMARERDLVVDRDDYETHMNAARERSRASTGGPQSMSLPPDAIARLSQDAVAATDDSPKYAMGTLDGHVKAIWDGNEFINQLEVGVPAGLVLDRTSFYAEQGGQVGDTGVVTAGGSTFTVNSTHRFGEFVLHEGEVSGEALPVNAPIVSTVDAERRASIEQNHTSTHLLNHALRAVLGDGVEQKGSLVASDRLRFDFSHRSAPTPDELEQIENRVREAIDRDLGVHAAEVPLDTAMTINGVRAVFGERYPDPVRVVSIGADVGELVENPGNPDWMECSIEFCGGTHLERTGAAGGFVIVQEQALAAGIRRIAALTGSAAAQATDEARALQAQVEAAAECDDAQLVEQVDELVRRVDEATLGLLDRNSIRQSLEALQGRVKAARKSAAKSSRNDAVALARTIAESADGDVITSLLDGVSGRDDLLSAMDTIRGNHPEAACLLMGTDPDAGKVVMVARVPEGLIARGLKAGDWVKHVAGLCGGGGGGRPDMAQAGGSKPEQAPAAVEDARQWAMDRLS
ncbi:MAG: alanine--tRNA ligase [Phycisphaerales bacterium]|nr:alanine--tRNA ligase [Phycisphaerales bacterium]